MKTKFATIILAVMIMLGCCFGASKARVYAASNYELDDLWSASDELSLSAYDLLRLYLGEDVSDKEREILSAQNITKFNGVEEADIDARFDGSILSVTASPLKTGVLTYVPQYVSAGGKTIDQSVGGKYVFEDVGDDGAITVHYKATAVIDKDVMNGIINKVYLDARAIEDDFAAKTEAYEADLRTYEQNKAVYDEYVRQKEIYDAAYEEYQAQLKKYNSDLILWQESYDAYQDYLADVENYYRQLEAYNNYDEVLADYNERLARFEEYQEQYRAYQKELDEYNALINSEDIKRQQYQLSILRYINQSVTDMNRSLGGAIMGDAVDEVLANRDMFNMAGIKMEVLNRAEKTTLALRELITRLGELESDEELYIFYVSNYNELKNNFSDLLRELDYIYINSSAAREKMDELGRRRQYEILLAQLYYISNAFDDKAVGDYEAKYGDYKKGRYYRDGFTFYGGKSPWLILGADIFEDQNLGEPRGSGYIEPPTAPTPIESVPDPGKPPEVVSKPVLPSEVAPPSDEKPIKPEMTMPMPDEVLEPKLPKRPVLSDDEAELVEMLQGELVERDTLKQNFEFTIERDKVIYLGSVVITLIFCDEDGDEIFTTTAEKSKPVENLPPTPSKQKEGCTYVFEGWVDASGKFVNLNRLVTDENVELRLYPRFTEIVNRYNITFVVEGEETTKTYTYGQIPVYDEDVDGELVKVVEGDNPYRFVGWECGDELVTEFKPVSDDATYTAVFERSLKVTFDIDGTLTERYFYKGDTPYYDGKTPTKLSDGTFIYVFTGWDIPFAPIDGDITYTAEFEVKQLVEGSSDPHVELTQSSYMIDIQYSSGEEMNISALVAQAEERNLSVQLTFVATSMSGAKFDADGGLNATLVLPLSAIKAMFEADVKTMRFFMTKGLGYEAYFEFGNGTERVKVDATAKLSVFGNFGENTYVYEGDAETRCTLGANGEVVFNMNIGSRYQIKNEFDILLAASENVTVTAERRATPGEEVKLTFSVPEGMFVSSVYGIRNDDGSRFVIEDGSFIMPDCAVTIGAISDYIIYEIVFMSNGNVLVVRKVRYGETVTPPPTPTKPSDDDYTYTFVGWDKDVVPATANVTYNAVFEKHEVTPYQRKTSALTMFIKTAMIGLPILLVLVVSAMVTLIVMRNKRMAALKTASSDREGSSPEATPEATVPVLEIKPEEKTEPALEVKPEQKPEEKTEPAPQAAPKKAEQNAPTAQKEKSVMGQKSNKSGQGAIKVKSKSGKKSISKPGSKK